jgi:hypothetical protein
MTALVVWETPLFNSVAKISVGVQLGAMRQIARVQSCRKNLRQYSCGFAKHPAPPLLKHELLSSVPAVNGQRKIWSRLCSVPSGFRWCICASLSFIFVVGNIEICFRPRGSNIFIRIYSFSDMLVTRSTATPAQSRLICR